MSKALHFHLVDDDPESIALLETVLRAAGHRVSRSESSLEALADILRLRPQAVLIDVMMPDLDGMELCRQLRDERALDATKLVMVSSKPFGFDRDRALRLGADGWFTKPITVQTFARDLERIVADEIELTYWGVRGTLPVPGAKTVRYGGNTSCVSLSFQDGPMFVFDAGTGIKALGTWLLARQRSPILAKIFISHPHWDHINALPFFAPLYRPGNEFEILGASHGEVGMRDLIGAQMDGVYFPITTREFGARVTYRDLHEEAIVLGRAKVATMLLSHPGTCLGYRVDHGNRSICYVTDNELFLPGSPHHNQRYVEKLASFVRGADVLITDCTYTDEDYPARTGWGHSCVSQVADLAHRGQVRALHLFHHDPDQDDDAIDAKLEATRRELDRLGSSVQPFQGRGNRLT